MHEVFAKQAALQGAGQEARLSSHLVRPSYLDNLRDQRDVLQSRLESINKLIGALENNKEFVEIIDLMGKV